MLNIEQALQNKRILIIDDLVQARSSLKKMVTLLGATQIDTATNGREASQRIMEHEYDIVLSDYNLGRGKDGQQVLEEARYCNRLKSTALFILVTGENAVDMVMGALEYEPDNYITKPFTLNMLRERLIRILATKQEILPIDLAIDAGNPDEAIALATAMLAEKPRLLMPLTRILGKLYLRQKRYQEALQTYQKLLEKRPVGWAQMGQAVCLHLLGDSRSALALLQQTLLAHPMYVQCHDWCATILLSMGEPLKAQQELQKAVAISPKAVLRQMELGRIAYDNGDFPVAEAAFEQAIRLGRYSCYKTSSNYLQFVDAVRQSLANSNAQANSRELRQLSDKAFKAIEELRQDYAGEDDIMFATCITEGKTWQVLGDEENCRQAAQRAEEILLRLKKPTLDQQLQMTEAYIDTQQHVKAKNLLQQLKDSGVDETALQQINALEENLNKMVIRDHTAALNTQGVSCYEKKDFASAVAAFDEAAAYEEAGISVLLNAIQAKISLVETTQMDVGQLKDCYRYFQRIGKVGETDERFERYERLKNTFLRLKRAAGL
ncbi:tetratricopeptide repeat-containing response regulator [Venatoribacter cucullus]|uniref:tetratricopeptide repeat-containing response regulator n=1 Tax=Venatoribacter cucullus TaxID=2661630 RepID=UPI002240D76A|nr:tetratricopeptide repeat-containing response regulator [Venatoribacter cucullus]UZK02396.1 tetratricopeptide repeat protein [Venatoribacter cucullus]